MLNSAYSKKKLEVKIVSKSIFAIAVNLVTITFIWVFFNFPIKHSTKPWKEQMLLVCNFDNRNI